MNPKQKQILAGCLAIGAICAVLYAVFGTYPSPSGKPLAKLPPGYVRSKDLDEAKAGKRPIPVPEKVQTEQSLTRQFLEIPSGRPDIPAVPVVLRNIFKYPPPPVQKEKPPPPPPPITITGLSQASVFGKTSMSNELTVRANPLPDGAQVYFDGVPVPGQQRVSANEIRMTLTPEMTRSPRSIGILVKVPGQEQKWYSNSYNLSVVEPPRPDVTYIGYIADAGGGNPQAVIKAGNEIQTMTTGQDYGRFRIKEITPQQIVLIDLQLAGVSHPFLLSGGTASGPGNPGNSGKY